MIDCCYTSFRHRYRSLLFVGARYTIVLVVFFPPYVLCEMPSNMVLRKVGTTNGLDSSHSHGNSHDETRDCQELPGTHCLPYLCWGIRGRCKLVTFPRWSPPDESFWFFPGCACLIN